MRRGVAAENPSHYTLDEKELERVSALARIELEDARVELERANEAMKQMGRGAEGDEADDTGETEDDKEDDWVEWVTKFSSDCVHSLSWCGSEEDESMDQDKDISHSAKDGEDDDLAKYKLDEYDEQSKSIGISSHPSFGKQS